MTEVAEDEVRLSSINVTQESVENHDFHTLDHPLTPLTKAKALLACWSDDPVSERFDTFDSPRLGKSLVYNPTLSPSQRRPIKGAESVIQKASTMREDYDRLKESRPPIQRRVLHRPVVMDHASPKVPGHRVSPRNKSPAQKAFHRVKEETDRINLEHHHIHAQTRGTGGKPRPAWSNSFRPDSHANHNQQGRHVEAKKSLSPPQARVGSAREGGRPNDVPYFLPESGFRGSVHQVTASVPPRTREVAYPFYNAQAFGLNMFSPRPLLNTGFPQSPQSKYQLERIREEESLKVKKVKPLAAPQALPSHFLKPIDPSFKPAPPDSSSKTKNQLTHLSPRPRMNLTKNFKKSASQKSLKSATEPPKADAEKRFLAPRPRRASVLMKLEKQKTFAELQRVRNNEVLAAQRKAAQVKEAKLKKEKERREKELEQAKREPPKHQPASAHPMWPGYGYGNFGVMGGFQFPSHPSVRPRENFSIPPTGRRVEPPYLAPRPLTMLYPPSYIFGGSTQSNVFCPQLASHGYSGKLPASCPSAPQVRGTGSVPKAKKTAGRTRDENERSKLKKKGTDGSLVQHPAQAGSYSTFYGPSWPPISGFRQLPGSSFPSGMSLLYGFRPPPRAQDLPTEKKRAVRPKAAKPSLNSQTQPNQKTELPRKPPLPIRTHSRSASPPLPSIIRGSSADSSRRPSRTQWIIVKGPSSSASGQQAAKEKQKKEPPKLPKPPVPPSQQLHRPRFASLQEPRSKREPEGTRETLENSKELRERKRWSSGGNPPMRRGQETSGNSKERRVKSSDKQENSLGSGVIASGDTIRDIRSGTVGGEEELLESQAKDRVERSATGNSNSWHLEGKFKFSHSPSFEKEKNFPSPTPQLELLSCSEPPRKRTADLTAKDRCGSDDVDLSDRAKSSKKLSSHTQNVDAQAPQQVSRTLEEVEKGEEEEADEVDKQGEESKAVAEEEKARQAKAAVEEALLEISDSEISDPSVRNIGSS